MSIVNRKVNQCKSKGIKVNCLSGSTDKLTDRQFSISQLARDSPESQDLFLL